MPIQQSDHTMPLNEESLVTRGALRHSISQDAVRTVLRALRAGGGSMAQFSHPEFGGMSQWSPGMTMVGDMFNNILKSKLNAVCSELAEYAAGSRDDNRGFNSEVSYRTPQKTDWWPAALGMPTSVGVQNNLRYAIFPRRLVISDGDRLEVYDTGNHRIFGVGQAQGSDQTLTFESQEGLVRVKDLPKVEG
jgi:hypothetical protein